jgi:hypothetical protein
LNIISGAINQLGLFCLAYGIASAWESFAHRTILHAHPKQSYSWRSLGRLGAALRQARFNHLVHHRLISSGSWSRQRIANSQQLSQKTIQQLRETEFGVLINPTWDALLLFAGVPISLIALIYLLAAPKWLPLGLGVALGPFFMTSYVHTYLHADEPWDSKKTQISHVTRLVYQVYWHLLAYHQEHHRDARRNFNLLLGWEYLAKFLLVLCTSRTGHLDGAEECMDVKSRINSAPLGRGHEAGGFN